MKLDGRRTLQSTRKCLSKAFKEEKRSHSPFPKYPEEKIRTCDLTKDNPSLAGLCPELYRACKYKQLFGRNRVILSYNVSL